MRQWGRVSQAESVPSNCLSLDKMAPKGSSSVLSSSLLNVKKKRVCVEAKKKKKRTLSNQVLRVTKGKVKQP
jgi:hypothetical protein